MILDGDIVKVGDRVHHITLGAGVVSTVEHGTARIKMERGGGVLNMGELGKVNGVKAFYWSDPILLIPRKNQKALLDEASILLDGALQLASERRKKLSGG